MTLIRILLIVLIFCNLSKGQTSLGLEFRTSLNSTFNRSEIIGGRNFILTDERDKLTWSYSFGAIYKSSSLGEFKIHIGKHQNGRIIDGRFETGLHGQIDEYEGIDQPFKFLQFVPSYSIDYSILAVDLSLESGVAINRLINYEEFFFVGIADYNFDLRLSIGAEYELYENYVIGIHGIYSKAISDYARGFELIGAYDPFQFGIELNLKCYFKEFVNEKQDEMEEPSL